MLYIHQAIAISPQETFPFPDLTRIYQPVDNKLEIREPSYEGIPRNLLRRMGKAVRMGIGASAPILRSTPRPVSGIVIGTGNGGTADSFSFLQQMKEYGEALLTPGSFAQSTSNAMASQLSMMDQNKSYNLTHVHRGLAFEMALLDVSLLSREEESAFYLLAGVDELSPSNYALDEMEGWYPPGIIAGEGAAAFLVSGEAQNAVVSLRAVATLHTSDVDIVREELANFLATHLPAGEDIACLFSGDNGDLRLKAYYQACERWMSRGTAVLHFKRFCGEYPTAAAFALWLAYHQHLEAGGAGPRNYLIYNTYKGRQHSFILLTGMSR
jgi:beta-ketoacyl synthase-like protein